MPIVLCFIFFKTLFELFSKLYNKYMTSFVEPRNPCHKSGACKSTLRYAKNWCFTCFGENGHLEGHHTDLHPLSTYMVVGKETCPETKREHLQGYVQMRTRTRLYTMKHKFCPFCHFIPASGNQSQNRAYCTKDGAWREFGDPITQGKRTDLHTLVEKLEHNKTTLSDVMSDHPTTYIRNYRGIKDWLCGVCPPQPRDVVIRDVDLHEYPPECYVFDAREHSRLAPYHGQTNMVVFHHDVFSQNNLYIDICQGIPCFLTDVPVVITEIYRVRYVPPQARPIGRPRGPS